MSVNRCKGEACVASGWPQRANPQGSHLCPGKHGTPQQGEACHCCEGCTEDCDSRVVFDEDDDK